jgi:uncharacterized protein (DUF4415 family)
MKKTEASEATETDADDMLAEYRFDYGKARPNRFASSMQKDHVTVTLDPDVAEVFKTSGSVNMVLRALITTMPKADKKKRAGKQIPKQNTQ